jgi:hypothetical protein
VTAEVKQIDDRIRAAWTKNGVTPSGRADDYEFIRRASLDVIGRIPRLDEIRVFFDDPPSKRRALLIDRLLAQKDYARHWAELWSGWLLGRTGTFGRGLYHNEMTAWLEDQFAHNRPYHEIVRGLVTAEGRSTRNGAVHFILAHRGQPVPPANRAREGQFDMVPITGRISQLFLGIQVRCAQCHDHPFEDAIKQEHFWRINVFLRQAECAGDPERGGPLTLADNPNIAPDPTVLFERRNGVIQAARKPDLTKSALLPPVLNARKGRTPRRRELAPVVIEHDNFSAALVNRMWSVFFGRGFVNPIDDFSELNDPSHPELLGELAALFKEHGYDLALLIRWICNSEAYQLGCVANRTNDTREHERLFSRRLLRPLSPEQLFDSLQTATGAAPAETRDAWLGRLVTGCDDCECHEIDFTGSLEQALSLLNGPQINDIVAAAVSRAVAEGVRELQVKPLTALYLAALGRPPRPGEVEKLRREFWEKQAIPGRDPDVFYEDLFWALLNSNEFALNH